MDYPLEVYRRYLGMLNTINPWQSSTYVNKPDLETMDEKHIEALRALGYVD